MSTILRALRRLEQEKAQDELVELHDSVVAKPPPKKRPVSTLLLVVCAAVAAAGLGGALTWQLLGGAAQREAIDVAAAPAPPPAEERRAAPITEPSDRLLEQAMIAMQNDETVVVDVRDGSVRVQPNDAAPGSARQVARAEPEISEEVIVHRRTPAAAPQQLARSAAAEVPEGVVVLDRGESKPGRVPVRRAPPAPVAAQTEFQSAAAEAARASAEGNDAAESVMARRSAPSAAPSATAPEPRSVPTPRESAPAIPRPPQQQVASVVADPEPAPEPEQRSAAKPQAAPQAVVEAEEIVEVEEIIEAEPEPAPPREATTALAPSDALPTLFVAKTVWHPSSDKRSAVVEIDGETRELREGDRVGELEVAKIKPSGVVFDFGGVELSRRVGESR